MINVRLADTVIAMDNGFTELERLCREYITEEPAEMTLRVNPEEIEAERQGQIHPFSDGYLETI